MDRFDYEFPVRIHFGQGCFEESLKQELQKYGKNVILAYGGGSLKRTGLYDRIIPPKFAFSLKLNFLVFPCLAFYLRSFCVNLRKSVFRYRLFS